MKTKFIALCALAFCNAAIAQNKVDVPPHIQAEFVKKYPTATKVVWEKENSKYESYFYLGKKEMYVLYNPSGMIEEIETVITIAELPAKAQKYAKQKGKVQEVGRIELANGAIQYEAEIKGKGLIFDDKGNFLEERIDTDDDKG